MTVGQTRSARRKTMARYGKVGRAATRSVGEAIQNERIKAARQAAAKKKK